MSVRKITPVKSQTRTTERKKEKPGISPKRLRIDTQKDTENPLPTSNDHNTTTINNTIVQSGFISARRRPLVIQPVVKTEEKDTDIDFLLFPEPIVETNDLIKKKQPVSEIESQTKPGIVNYKRFRKAQNPDCCSSFDRIIGGSDLSVYAIEVES